MHGAWKFRGSGYEYFPRGIQTLDAIPNMVRICFPSFLPSCGCNIDYLLSVEESSHFYSNPYVGNAVDKSIHHSVGEIPSAMLQGHWPQTEIDTARFLGWFIIAMYFHLVCIFPRLAPAKQSYQGRLVPHVLRRVDWKKDCNVLEFLSPFPEITVTGKCWTQVLTRDGKSYALGSYAKDLWVTWNLHVTCWTQTLEKANLLLIV